MLTFSSPSLSLVQYARRWEKPDINSNGNPVRVGMHVKTGDTVQVVAGKDKGKVGEVLKCYRQGLKAGLVLVRDVNLATKAVRPQNQGETGQLISTERPLHHSNVMHYSQAQKVRSRVRFEGEGRDKRRVLVKTGEVLPERADNRVRAAEIAAASNVEKIED